MTTSKKKPYIPFHTNGHSKLLFQKSPIFLCIPMAAADCSLEKALYSVKRAFCSIRKVALHSAGLSKEPYLLLKEPYIVSKEPYIPSIEPYAPFHTNSSSRFNRDSRCILQGSFELGSRALLMEYRALLIPMSAADSPVTRVAFCRALSNWEIWLF